MKEFVSEYYDFNEIDSTNDFAKSLIPKHQTLITSRSQTNGHGTQGRTFQSLADKGIYMSYIIDTKLVNHGPSSIPLIMACAIGKVLEQIRITPRLKWVNDVYISDKKCAGILCEQLDDTHLVIGVGINVFKQEFADDIKDRATSLANHTDLELNIINLIDRLLFHFNWFLTQDFQEMHSYYLSKLIDLNKPISFLVDTKQESGVITGIDELGRLLISDGSALCSSQQIIHIESEGL